MFLVILTSGEGGTGVSVDVIGIEHVMSPGEETVCCWFVEEVRDDEITLVMELLQLLCVEDRGWHVEMSELVVRSIADRRLAFPNERASLQLNHFDNPSPTPTPSPSLNRRHASQSRQLGSPQEALVCCRDSPVSIIQIRQPNPPTRQS